MASVPLPLSAIIQFLVYMFMYTDILHIGVYISRYIHATMCTVCVHDTTCKTDMYIHM